MREGCGEPGLLDFRISILDLLCLASLCRRAPASNETESGAKMKIAVAILFFAGLFGLSSGQEGPPTNRAVPPPVGLEIGQPAPAFALFAPPIGDPSAKRSSCSCKAQSNDLRRKD